MTVKVWLRTVDRRRPCWRSPSVAAAQQSVSIERYSAAAGSGVPGGLRGDPAAFDGLTLASRLETELDDLRDEVVYLKVKMRKDGTVSRSEYADLRDRIQDAPLPCARRASQSSAGNAVGVRDDRQRGCGRHERRLGSGAARRPPSDSPSTSRSTIPVGQEIDVRLQTELTSDTAQVEDRFEATTVVDLYRGNEVLIPAGSVMRGVVSSVNRASRTDRKGSMTVAFDQVTVNGRSYPMRGTVTQALESEGMKGEIGRIGAGSAVGAIIGGILGGGKGALLGVLIGGGGTIAATEGKDVTCPRERCCACAWTRRRKSEPAAGERRRTWTDRSNQSSQALVRPVPELVIPVHRSPAFFQRFPRRFHRLLDIPAPCAPPEMNHASNCEGGG